MMEMQNMLEVCHNDGNAKQCWGTQNTMHEHAIMLDNAKHKTNVGVQKLEMQNIWGSRVHVLITPTPIGNKCWPLLCVVVNLGPGRHLARSATVPAHLPEHFSGSGKLAEVCPLTVYHKPKCRQSRK